MFKCKDRNGAVRQAEWLNINHAWVSVVTVCSYALDKHTGDIPRGIPDVTGLELEQEGSGVNVTWNPSKHYKTQIQYRIDGGDWVTMELVDERVGEA